MSNLNWQQAPPPTQEHQGQPQVQNFKGKVDIISISNPIQRNEWYNFSVTTNKGVVAYGSKTISTIAGLPFKAGTAIDAEIIGGQYPKLKIPYTGKGGFQKKSDPSSFALSYAKDIVVAQMVNTPMESPETQVIAMADKFLAWLKKNAV